MSFPSIDSSYRISSASTTYMHICLLRATESSLPLSLILETPESTRGPPFNP
jgi:hypothetical protein